jgi:hypothetical protein
MRDPFCIKSDQTVLKHGIHKSKGKGWRERKPSLCDWRGVIDSRPTYMYIKWSTHLRQVSLRNKALAYVCPLNLSAMMLKNPRRSRFNSADIDSDPGSSCDENTTATLSEGSIYRSRDRPRRHATLHNAPSDDLPQITADGSVERAETLSGDITPYSTSHGLRPDNSFDRQSDSSSSVSSIKAHQGTPENRLPVS